MQRTYPRIQSFLGSATAALVLLLGTASLPIAAQEPELIPMWDASDESNPATIDHGAWQEILDRYLLTDHPSGVHRFDYGALKANAEDRQKLGAYLRRLGHGSTPAPTPRPNRWPTGSISTTR